MNFIKRLIIVIIGLSILIGIPYQFGAGWLFLSWLPALSIMGFLED